MRGPIPPETAQSQLKGAQRAARGGESMTVRVQVFNDNINVAQFPAMG